MTKQYFCEYCDRTFRDTLQDRKKHRESVAHCSSKFDYEMKQLGKLSHKYQAHLSSILNEEDWWLLNEITRKPHSCRFHFETKNCRYGLICKNSHHLSDDQIRSGKDTLLERLSNWKTSYHLVSSLNLQQPVSKRQLKLEYGLDRWLERRFGMENRSDLVASILHSQPNTLGGSLFECNYSL